MNATIENTINKIKGIKNLTLYVALIVAVIIFGAMVLFLANMNSSEDIAEIPLKEDVHQDSNQQNSNVESYPIDNNVINKEIIAQASSNVINAPFEEEKLLQDKQESFSIDLSALQEQPNNINTQNNTQPSMQHNIQEPVQSNPLDDIKSYLKSIQSGITLDKDRFYYQGNTYRVGDKFGNYLVESIDSIYIRFVDDKSALHYNLRFLDNTKGY